MKVGEQYRADNTTAQIIVMRATDQEVELTCAGEPMTKAEPGTRPTAVPPSASGDEQAQLLVGKRYVDAESGVELLCTTAGAGPLRIDGRALDLADAKLLPSSD